MYSCGAGVSDYHKKLAEDLYFSSDGSRREIIIGSKSESGILIDSILILPTIESYKCNDEYIIVKQRPNKDLSICLHSKSLEFIHPVTKKQLKIEANFPDLKIWNSL